ncbi:MAG: DUF4286 family protein [Ferruginibacter sp.]
MIIFNVTTKVHSTIQNDWLTWLKEEHIPDIMNTGCFTRAVILQLLETDETEGPTYAIQYHAENKALYNRYIENFSVILLQKSFDKWGDQFASFPSVLQVVN